MIVYRKSGFLGGLWLLSRAYGSPIPRAVPYALTSAVIAVLLELYYNDQCMEMIVHPYPYQVFAFLVGFSVIFRAQIAHTRYWEARNSLQQMSSKWGDVAYQAINFDFNPDPAAEHFYSHNSFQANIIHALSLMHALAIQQLRKDPNLGNLVPYQFDNETPVVDAKHIDNWKPSFADYWILRGTSTRLQKYHTFQSLAVLGGISSYEQMRFEEEQDVVGTIYGWVHQMMVKRQVEGGLKIPPPILSRTYQALTDGMLGFQLAMKIADTPFPFPYVQVVFVLLLLLMITFPMMVCSKMESLWWGPFITFLSVLAYFSFNEVAIALEDAYLYDPNDLPLVKFQHDYNNRLLAAFRNCSQDSWKATHKNWNEQGELFLSEHEKAVVPRSSSVKKTDQGHQSRPTVDVIVSSSKNSKTARRKQEQAYEPGDPYASSPSMRGSMRRQSHFGGITEKDHLHKASEIVY